MCIKIKYTTISEFKCFAHKRISYRSISNCVGVLHVSWQALIVLYRLFIQYVVEIYRGSLDVKSDKHGTVRHESQLSKTST